MPLRGRLGSPLPLPAGRSSSHRVRSQFDPAPSMPKSGLQHPYNDEIPVTPAAVTQPTSAEGVSGVVQCAAANGFKVQPRSGGHSYGNYGIGGQSGAVVVDLSSFQQFSMDNTTWQATIGAGTLLSDVTTRLNGAGGRAIAHGTCPQVGVGGHATIGGLGPISRQWGTTLDHVLEVEIVLANGTITRANETTNADIFWAVKGAGASFGIITEFVFLTHPAPTNAVVYSYEILLGSHASHAPIFAAWQSIISDPQLDRNLASEVIIFELGMIVSGTYFGTIDEFNSLNFTGRLQNSNVTVSELDSWLGIVDNWAENEALQVVGGISGPFYAKSLTFNSTNLIPQSGIDDFFTYLDNADKGTLIWFAVFDVEGGAINDVAQNATAYAHRNAQFYLQTYAVGVGSLSNTTISFVENMTNIITDAIPGLSGAYAGYVDGAYAGYVDPRLSDGQQQYWGANLPRLEQIKASVDPMDVFHNPQSVAPVANASNNSSGSPSSGGSGSRGLQQQAAMRPFFATAAALAASSTTLPSPSQPGSALQICLNEVFSANRTAVHYPQDVFYQYLYVKPYNKNIPIVPAAVTEPRTAQDVADIVKCATASGVKVTPRSGGHSYGNYCIGGENGAVVVDLVNFQQFSMDNTTWYATIGAGTLLADVTTRLHDAGGRAIAHGTCPQVGVGGHATIGGLGPISREWGTALDHIVEVEVVLANGTIIRANSSSHPEVLFAIQGAAASFGIVTEFVFRTHPEMTSAVVYSYKLVTGNHTSHASTFSAWQSIISDPDLDRRLASQVIIFQLGMIITGTFFGTLDEFNALNFLGRLENKNAIVTVSTLDSWLGIVGNWAENEALQLIGGVASPFYAKSLAFTPSTLIPEDGITKLFDYFDQASKGTLIWFAIMDLAGGAVNDVPQNATGYAHRDVLYYLQTYAVGIVSLSNTTTAFIQGISDALLEAMPNLQPEAYAGYVDPQLTDGQHEYWGANLPRLEQIKAEIDPEDVFHNPQSCFDVKPFDDHFVYCS
uniref:Reticuline oxidase n=1 Tax=Mycena chlorophos TaxID=658473 RepID=A0ABQ0LQU4_MYCCL|nr:reticuline oxidase [Mycena chlorophos]